MALPVIIVPERRGGPLPAMLRQPLAFVIRSIIAQTTDAYYIYCCAYARIPRIWNDNCACNGGANCHNKSNYMWLNFMVRAIRLWWASERVALLLSVYSFIKCVIIFNKPINTRQFVSLKNNINSHFKAMWNDTAIAILYETGINIDWLWLWSTLNSVLFVYTRTFKTIVLQTAQPPHI